MRFAPLIIVLASLTGYGQNLGNIDSLRQVLPSQKEDTNKVKVLYSLSFYYVAGSFADTGLAYAQQALELAEKLNNEPGIFWSEITLGEALAILGNYPSALEHDFRALALANKLDNLLMKCYGNGSLAGCYYYMGDYSTSIKYARIVTSIIDTDDIYWMWVQMSKSFHSMGQPDSAVLYATQAYGMISRGDFLYAMSVISPVLGNAYAGKGNYDSALYYYRMGIPLSRKSRTETHLIDNYNGIAGVYQAKGNLDSALWYSEKIFHEKITIVYPIGMLKAANTLAAIYQSRKNPDSTLKYLQLATAIKDSLTNRQKTIAVQNLIYNEQVKQKEIAAFKLEFRNRLKLYALIAALLAIMITTMVVRRNNRRKQVQLMRNNIADDLHDDIGSTLSSISIMSELAKKKSPEAAPLLASINESALSIQENMGDIVWAIKSDNDSFDKILQRMNQFATEILDARNIALNFMSDASLSSLKLKVKQRKNLYLFFKEVINNTAKHSDASNVSVSISKKEHHIVMSIRDDGKGFNTWQTYSGNGMHTLKKRAEELSGHFEIQSNIGEGTTVDLTFKIT